MKHSDTSFFCYKDHEPRVVIYSLMRDIWPYIVSIYDPADITTGSTVTIYFSSLEQLTNFSDSITSAMSEVLRRKETDDAS